MVPVPPSGTHRAHQLSPRQGEPTKEIYIKQLSLVIMPAFSSYENMQQLGFLISAWSKSSKSCWSMQGEYYEFKVSVTLPKLTVSLTCGGAVKALRRSGWGKEG